MIDDTVKTLAMELSGFWTGLLRDHPRYALDFSYSSLGTLNLVLCHLFDRPELSEQDQQLVLHAAAYVGAGAYAAWSNFGEGIAVELTHEGEPPSEIWLSAKGGPWLGAKERFRVGVFSALKKALSGESGPRLFEQHDARREWKDHRVEMFAAGLYSGLSPFGEGKWTERSYGDSKAALAPVNSHLSQTCARYYAAVHPAEEIGTDELVYLRSLLLPPAGFDEEFFCGRASYHLAHYLHTKVADHEARREVALNLALSPHFQLAAAGYAVSVALCGKVEPSQKLIGVSEAFGSEKLTLKHAIVLARNVFGTLPSLPTKLPEVLEPELELLLQIEQQLGLLPLWRTLLEDIAPIPLLPQLLYWNRAADARVAIDRHAAEHALTQPQILQGIYLDLMSGNFERAKGELQDRVKNAALKDIDSPPLLALRDELISSVAIYEGDFVLAAGMLERAAAYPGLPLSRQSSLLSLRAEILFAGGSAEEALACAESAVKIFPNIAADIGRVRILRQLRPDDLTVEQIDSIIRIAPRNAEAFWMLQGEKLKQLA